MSLKEKIAALLDALADEREAGVYAEVADAEFSAEVDPIMKFATAYRDITGEDLDASLRERLERDPDLREAVTKVAVHTPQRPTPMGEAQDEGRGGADEAQPRSRKESEKAAYDRFASRILDIGSR